MPEKNKSFKVVLLIICLFTAIFSSIVFAKCINIEKSLHAYPSYNQTWLKLSENLNSEKQHLLSNTLNQNLSSEYDNSIIVDIPTNNKMVVYTETNFMVDNIIKMIDVLPTLEFKKHVQNNKWANTDITGKDIKKADVTALNEGEYAISIEFTKNGAEKFANMVGAINSANISYEIIKVGRQNIVILVIMGLLFIISLGTIVIFIVSKIKKIAEKGKCVNCGHVNKSGQKFCSKCGSKL